MTDPQPAGDLRDYLCANMLDGDESGEHTFSSSIFLDEVVDVVAQWLGDPAGTPPATFTRQQAADWLAQNTQATP